MFGMEGLLGWRRVGTEERVERQCVWDEHVLHQRPRVQPTGPRKAGVGSTRAETHFSGIDAAVGS